MWCVSVHVCAGHPEARKRVSGIPGITAVGAGVSKLLSHLSRIPYSFLSWDVRILLFPLSKCWDYRLLPPNMAVSEVESQAVFSFLFPDGWDNEHFQIITDCLYFLLKSVSVFISAFISWSSLCVLEAGSDVSRPRPGLSLNSLYSLHVWLGVCFCGFIHLRH